MSAIWGAVSFENHKLPENIPAVFRRSYAKCVLDRVEEMQSESVYMGCGIQYFTKEAEAERLPLQESDIFFTADVFFDNREELIEQLDVQAEDGAELPDGELLYRMYRQYGEVCLNDLLGSYAFVYYDREKRQADLVIDAVGDRMVYYTVHEQVLYFSSLLMPLAEVTGAKLNDRWMTDFLAMDHLFMINETVETPFQNIFRVAPAHSVSISPEGVQQKKYWNPMETVKPLVLKSDEEYKAAFQKVFFEAVRSKLRTQGEVSALLSGGYDSTAVVAVASHILKEKGDKIISFTSVPLSDYEEKNDNYYVENEAELVEQTVQYLGNVEPYYVQMPGVNPWNGHAEGMNRVEMPYKSSMNFLWIPECMRQAKEKGAKVMLTGSYGNTTISYENVEIYFAELKRRGKLLRLNREIKAFAANYGFDPVYAKKEVFAPKKRSDKADSRWRNLYKKSYVRPSIVARTGCDERMLSMNRMFAESVVSHEKQRELMMHELSLRQIGEIAVKNSLATGILLRDPTKDKRIIEFCMSLPFDQFNKDGEGRRLVSQYLKEYLPSHIFEKKYRGRQSADFSYRISLDWENIRSEWMQQCRECADSRYVDAGYEYVQLKKAENIADYTQMDLTRHVYTQMVLEYEKKYSTGFHAEAQQALSETTPLISVIVPVYNSESSLKKCVDSILSQTYRNLEIILVDDGSTDGSGALCDALAREDERVKVIHRQNRGVAGARNAGLDIATGAYIGFVDGDDYIYPTMYEVMLKNILKYHAQMAGCGVECIDYDGKDITACEGFTFVYHGAEMLETFLGYSRRTAAVAISVWNKLFSRELLKNKRFMEIRKYEDLEFTWSVMSRLSRAVFVDEPLYHYEMKKNGLHNQKYGALEFREFIQREKSILENLRTCANIREEGYLNHVFYFYTRLLEWLCGKKGRLGIKDWMTGRKCLHSMRKEVIQAVGNISQMKRRERCLCYTSLYSVSLYRLLKKLAPYIGKLKRKTK